MDYEGTFIETNGIKLHVVLAGPDIRIINSSRKYVALYYKMWSKKVGRDRIFDFITEQNLGLIEENIQTRSVYLIDYNAALATQ